MKPSLRTVFFLNTVDTNHQFKYFFPLISQMCTDNNLIRMILFVEFV